MNKNSKKYLSVLKAFIDIKILNKKIYEKANNLLNGITNIELEEDIINSEIYYKFICTNKKIPKKVIFRFNNKRDYIIKVETDKYSEYLAVDNTLYTTRVYQQQEVGKDTVSYNIKEYVNNRFLTSTGAIKIVNDNKELQYLTTICAYDENRLIKKKETYDKNQRLKDEKYYIINTNDEDLLYNNISLDDYKYEYTSKALHYEELHKINKDLSNYKKYLAIKKDL